MQLEIFVPFWGEPDLLYKMVDSVRDQSDPEWKLVVLDDCYPDPSVAEYFAALTDPRIEYIRNESNVGVTGNFRKAVSSSTASHITIPGCDDLLRPDYVRIVKSVIARMPKVDIIQPGVEVIDDTGQLSTPLVDQVKHRLLSPKGSGATVLSGEALATSLIRGNWLYWPSLTFRAETLKRIDFRADLRVIQDLALVMDIAFDDGSLAYVPELAFAYRRHSSSVSQRMLLDGSRFAEERSYYELAAELAEKKGWRRTARTARLRAVSRLHAITELPGVARHGTKAGVRSVLRHIFG